jgi:hypothetical protein
MGLIRRSIADTPRRAKSANLPGKEQTGQIIQKKTKNLAAAFELKNDLLTQGYGVDCAKIIHPTTQID